LTSRDRTQTGDDRTAFWALVSFLVLVFLMGGGSRADSMSLAVLRPLTCIFLGVGIYLHRREDYLAHRWVFGLAMSSVILTMLHLIPLPPAVWQMLPGRELITQIDRAVQPGPLWRPLTLVPQDGWNTLFSLLVPLVGLLLAARLSSDQHSRLVLVVLGIAAASVLLGLLQIQGSASGSLYFHRITNEGKLVGPFANRNHMAIFIASVIPLLAFVASRKARDSSDANMKLGLAVGGGFFFLAALLVIGSRAGFVLGIISAMAALALYRRPELQRRLAKDQGKAIKSSAPRLPRAVAFAALLAIIAGVSLTSESETTSRVFQSERGEELRVKVVGPILEMSGEYFPVGSGAGSFVEVYKVGEPFDVLNPTYLNHAHNDYLEILLTFGLPGILIVIIGLVMAGRAGRAVLRTKKVLNEDLLRSRAAFASLCLLALASFADYPLRTPSLALLFIVSAVWLSRGWAHARAATQRSNDA
jgi:O-antigen ligase